MKTLYAFMEQYQILLSSTYLMQESMVLLTCWIFLLSNLLQLVYRNPVAILASIIYICSMIACYSPPTFDETMGYSLGASGSLLKIAYSSKSQILGAISETTFCADSIEAINCWMFARVGLDVVWSIKAKVLPSSAIMTANFSIMSDVLGFQCSFIMMSQLYIIREGKEVQAILEQYKDKCILQIKLHQSLALQSSSYSSSESLRPSLPSLWSPELFCMTQSISGCFNFICWAIDPSVPYDFSHPLTWQMYFLSISFAHLLTRFFFSSVSSFSISQKEAIRSASYFFSSSDFRSCWLRRLLSAYNLLISAMQQLMAVSMLPSKLLICSVSDSASLLYWGYSCAVFGKMMRVFLVPYLDGLLILLQIRLYQQFKSGKCSNRLKGQYY